MTVRILPAGTSPAGLGAFVELDEAQGPPAILADAIDTLTGEIASLTRAMDPTDAAVLTALRTVRDSGASVRGIGHRFGDVSHVDDSAERMLEHHARQALRRLTEDRQIRIASIGVTAEPSTDWAQVTITYENLRTGKRESATVRVRHHGN